MIKVGSRRKKESKPVNGRLTQNKLRAESQMFASGEVPSQVALPNLPKVIEQRGFFKPQ